MTAITALNVRLGMDASNFSAGADLARAEVNRVASVMRQSVPPAEKFKKEVELLEKAFSDAGKQTQDYANAVEFLQKKHMQGKYSAEAIAAAQKKEADARALAIEQTKRQAEAVALAQAKEREAQKQAALALQRKKDAADKLKQSVAELAREEQKHDQLLRKQTESIRGMRAETEKAASANSNMMSTVRNLAAAYVSFQGAKAGIAIASDMEQASIAFEVMTGSAEKGAKTLGDLRSFAASTPITLNGAQQAAKTLLAFGLETERIMPTLRNLGDISGGNEERFKSLALAFAQTSATGRLMGQEVLQMVNAGFNPLQEISRTTGISMVELKKQMENGAISADMVAAAFASASGPTGRFFGMMDRMSKTAEGSYNQLISSIQEMVAQVGQHLLPILASAAKSMETVVRATSSLLGAMDKSQVQLLAMVGAFAATAFVIPKVVAGIGFMIAALKTMTTAQVTALAFSGPKGWAQIAAGAVAAAIAVDQVNKAYERMNAEAEKANKGAGEKAAEVAGKIAGNAAAGMAKPISPLQTEFLKMEHSLNEQVKLLNLGEDAYRRQTLYQKGMSMAQVARIERLHQELKLIERQAAQQKKLAEDQKRQAEERKRLAEEMDKAFTSEVQTAMKAVEDYYAKAKKLDDERRQQVSAGPGAGMEVGSADAAKFMADQVNAAIGAAAVPQTPTPGEKEIAEKTRELLIEQRQNNKKQEEQLKTMKDLLTEFKGNKFTRIR
jgi:tape measure domain-containing protein